MLRRGLMSFLGYQVFSATLFNAAIMSHVILPPNGSKGLWHIWILCSFLSLNYGILFIAFKSEKNRLWMVTVLTLVFSNGYGIISSSPQFGYNPHHWAKNKGYQCRCWILFGCLGLALFINGFSASSYSEEIKQRYAAFMLIAIGMIGYQYTCL